MVRGSVMKAQAQVERQRIKYLRSMMILGLLSAIFFVVSISVGRAGITNPVMILRSVFGQGEEYKQMLLILRNIRVPRACASFLVGACLAISGLVYQTTFNNKLVSPDILGTAYL